MRITDFWRDPDCAVQVVLGNCSGSNMEICGTAMLEGSAAHKLESQRSGCQRHRMCYIYQRFLEKKVLSTPHHRLYRLRARSLYNLWPYEAVTDVRCSQKQEPLEKNSKEFFLWRGHTSCRHTSLCTSNCDMYNARSIKEFRPYLK